MIWTKVKSCDNVAANERGVLLVSDSCATLRFSTAGMPEPARVQAVRDLHIRERTFLPAGLESIEPLEPLPGRSVHVDVTKRTLPGLAVVSATLSSLRHAIRPRGGVANGEDDLLLGVNVRGCSMTRQRDRDLTLRDGDAFFATRDMTEITITRPTPARFIGIRVPRQPVAMLLGRLDDTPVHLIPHRTEALTLLVSYARAIAHALPLATPELQRLAVTHMPDLIAATSGPRAMAERLRRDAALPQHGCERS